MSRTHKKIKRWQERAQDITRAPTIFTAFLATHPEATLEGCKAWFELHNQDSVWEYCDLLTLNRDTFRCLGNELFNGDGMSKQEDGSSLPPLHNHYLWQRLWLAFRGNSVYFRGKVLECYVATQMQTHGPKVLKLTQYQAGMYEHMAVRVAMADYHHSFPTMIIELPEAYAENRLIKFDDSGERGPRYIVVHHDAKAESIIVITSFGKLSDCWTCINARNAATIEESLQRLIQDGLKAEGEPDKGGDIIIVKLCRLALNALLTLYHRPHKSLPTNPDALAKLTRNLAKAKMRNNVRAIQSLQEEIDRTGWVLWIEQTIKVRTKPFNSEATGEPRAGGWRHLPGWRSGHSKMVRCGAGRTEKRLVQVEAYMIHAEEFGGDGIQASSDYTLD